MTEDEVVVGEVIRILDLPDVCWSSLGVSKEIFVGKQGKITKVHESRHGFKNPAGKTVNALMYLVKNDQWDRWVHGIWLPAWALDNACMFKEVVNHE